MSTGPRSDKAARSGAQRVRVSMAGLGVAHYLEQVGRHVRRWIPPVTKGGAWSVTTEQPTGYTRPPHPDAGDTIVLTRVVVDQEKFAAWPASRRRRFDRANVEGVVAYASFGGQTVAGKRPARGTVLFFP